MYILRGVNLYDGVVARLGRGILVRQCVALNKCILIHRESVQTGAGWYAFTVLLWGEAPEMSLRVYTLNAAWAKALSG
jgi:hypothetical protein